jgi:PST family polysaccharide transporter
VNEPDTAPANLTQTVVRGAGLAGAGYVLAEVFTLAFYLALARLLTPGEFGEFAAGSLLVTIGLLFTEGGMMAAVIHREDRVDEAASTAVVATAAAGLGFSLLALAVSPLLGYFFDSSTVGEVAAATSALLFIRSLGIIPAALLQRRFSFLRRVIIEPAQALALGTAAVIAAANGLGVWSLVIGFYAAALTDAALSWGLVSWRPRLRSASVAMWRELIGYGRYVLASVAVMRVGEQIPVLVIGRAFGTAPLGQFRYAIRMGSVPLSAIVQAAAYVLFPALARITADRERFRGAALRSLRITCAVGFPLSFLLVPLGVPAAVILFGDVWEQAGEAAMVFAAFCLGAILISYVSELVKADGRPDIQARTHVVSVLTATVLMLALIPTGFLGVVAGFSLGSVCGGLYGLWRIRPLVDLSTADVARELWPPFLAGAVMAGLLTLFERGVVDTSDHALALSLVLLGAEALAGLALYGAALYALAPGTVRDLGDVAGRLRRGRRGAAAATETVLAAPDGGGGA